MREKEFEQSVQQSLNELRLPPSSRVWDVVEAELRRDKRRRRIIWIPIAVAAGVGGLFLWNGLVGVPAETGVPSSSPAMGYNRSEAPASGTESSSSTETSSSVESQNNRTTEITSTPLSADQQPVFAEGTNSTAAAGSGSAGRTAVFPGLSRMNRQVQKSPMMKDPQSSVIRDREQTAGSENSMAVTRSEQAAEPDSPVRTDVAEPLTTMETAGQASVGTDSVQGQPVKPVAAAPASADSVLGQAGAPKPADIRKVQARRKWEWSVAPSAGISAMGDGLAGFDRLLNGTPQFAVDPSAITPLPPGGFGPAVNYDFNYPQPQPAASVGLDVQVKRRIARNVRLVSGIGYRWNRSTLEVGRRVNDPLSLIGTGVAAGGINYYYPTGSSETFVNSLHTLSLPVGIEWKAGRLPLFLEGGVAYTRIFAKRLLTYDPFARVHYPEQDGLQQNQFSLYASLGWQFLRNSRHPLTVGPVLHVSPGQLYKKNGPDAHLGWFGLRAAYRLQ